MRALEFFRMICLAGGLALLPGASEAGVQHRTMVVKYRTHGEYALRECAERLDRSGRRFQEEMADHSDSVDRLRERFRVQRHRAVFRDTRGPDFSAERERLTQRHQRRRAPISRPATAISPAPNTLPDLSHVYRVEIPEGINLAAAVSAFDADPHVEYAQPDYAIEVDQQVPFDDPFLGTSGAWGQSFEDLWGLTKIGAPTAWETTLGESTIVAVADTGLDWTHPDIVDNLWINPGEDLNGNGRFDPSDENGVDDDDNGFIDDLIGFDFAESLDVDEDGFYDGPEDVSDPDPFDTRGHGTHVAGTIAAVADNGEGIVGVAPGARIMALKGFPAEGPGRDTDLWRAVLYAAEMGATVVNNSWSCGSPCPTNRLAEEVLALVEAFGTTVVTSAGNRRTAVAFRSPENTRRVISVGASGVDDSLASFSNRGWGMDLVAPGGGGSIGPPVAAVPSRNILSLLTSAELPNESLFIVGHRYRRLAGTSMSSPHVAGAVALLKSVRPELTPREVRMLFRRSARDLGLEGTDATYGAGNLDLVRLLEAPLPDLVLDIEGPPTATLLDPADGPVELSVVGRGGDLVSLEVSIGRGLFGRPFVPIESFDGTTLEREDLDQGQVLRVSWDLATAVDGPYVLRARANLREGPPYDEYLVLGVERARPFELADGVRIVGAPAVAGRQVVWPMTLEADSIFDYGLAFAQLDRRSAATGRGKRGREDFEDPIPLVPVSGTPRELDFDGKLAIWRTLDQGVFRLEWCRVVPRVRAVREKDRPADASDRSSSIPPCEPLRLDRPSGLVSRPSAGAGWILWQREDGLDSYIEGCYVGRRVKHCEVEQLVDLSEPPRWTLRSFDGQSLLLQDGSRLALCRLGAPGTPCVLEEISFVPGTPPASEALHDGDTIVFAENEIRGLPPAGCLAGDPIPECRPTIAVSTRYRACVLDGPANTCDSAPVTTASRFETQTGIAVSGRRIVWGASDPLERPSIRFCEFDPVGKACPEQRLTGALNQQGLPAIDGHRVVWQGSRNASASIFGHGLPSVKGPAQVKRRAGTAFSIPLRANRGSGETLRYEISIDEASSADFDIPLRVEDRGRPGGFVRVRGRLPRDAEGRTRFRVRAIADTGLYSDAFVEIEAIAPPNASERSRRKELPGRKRSSRAPAKVSKQGR